MMRDEMKTVNQLRKAKATESSYFWHSILAVQPPRSWKYKTVMPAEDEAAARDNVAVTCSQSVDNLLRLSVVEFGYLVGSPANLPSFE